MAQLTGFGLMNDLGQLEQQQQQHQQQQLSMSPQQQQQGGFVGEKPYVKILEQPAENKLRFR